MSLKSRSEIYDRLEKLLYEFTSLPNGLTVGKEPTKVLMQRFAHWLTHKAAVVDDENHP